MHLILLKNFVSTDQFFHFLSSSTYKHRVCHQSTGYQFQNMTFSKTNPMTPHLMLDKRQPKSDSEKPQSSSQTGATGDIHDDDGAKDGNVSTAAEDEEAGGRGLHRCESLLDVSIKAGKSDKPDSKG